MGEGWNASRHVGVPIIWPPVLLLGDSAHWVPGAQTGYLLAPGA